ncbi:MAG: L-aspartate oxidase [Campylobacterales bacterium]
MFDVLVVGSGLAGLSAALEAKKAGLSVAVMTKGNPFRSNSSMASGGINAALGTAEPDLPSLHAQDTIAGADGLSGEAAVRFLCENGPKTVQMLDALGAGFDRDEKGRIAQRSFGGAGRKRTCYIQDKTGAGLVQALMRACNEAGVVTLSNHYLLSLLTRKNRISGVCALKQADSSVVAIEAKSVVLAGGGYAGVYFGHTTNPASTGGDILAAAFRAGLRLVNMEFVQFHPTGLEGSGELVSEAVRGEGGYLILEDGSRFTDELQTRDKLAREIARAIEAGHRVFVDVRHLGEELIQSRLPTFRRAAMTKLGLDPVSEPVPIRPSAHYTMGGIETDAEGQTAIGGLFACGECAYNGVHGANRLGGNSLLEAAVFGQLAGKKAASFAKHHALAGVDEGQLTEQRTRTERILGGESRFNINALRKSLGKTLTLKAGIFRDSHGLNDALDYIEYLHTLAGGLHCVDKGRSNNVELVMILEFLSALEVAEVTVLAALKRKESRGAHYRIDYPQHDDKFRKNSYSTLKGGHYYDVQLLKPGGFEWWLDRVRKALIN